MNPVSARVFLRRIPTYLPSEVFFRLKNIAMANNKKYLNNILKNRKKLWRSCHVLKWKYSRNRLRGKNQHQKNLRIKWEKRHRSLKYSNNVNNLMLALIKKNGIIWLNICHLKCFLSDPKNMAMIKWCRNDQKIW